MRKRIIALLTLLLLCTAVFPVCANAVTPLEPDRPCTLTLTYGKDGTGFADLEVQLYRVAEAHPDGTFDLIAPYSGYPVNIHGITAQKEWKDTATTLVSYITSKNLSPDAKQKTGENGKVVFSNLETGLYLVGGITVQRDTGTYVFDDFMIYLPTPTESGFDYDMEAVPKCSSYDPKTEYKVTKLWKDSGYTSSRPKSISVEIRKDGKLQETVTLNSANNWTYSWQVSSGDTGKWTVAEKDVSDQYKVTVSENSGSFTITNTRQSTSSNPPKTGDTFALGPWVMVMCLSGCLLLVLSVYGRRRR